jgi:hypothetical protein
MENNKFFFSPVRNRETTNAAKKLKKNKFFPNIIYMSNPASQKQFSSKVNEGDIVEIHADGLPWVTGGTHYNDDVDHNPFTLAKYFSKLLIDKDINLTIDLRFCTSGVYVTGPTEADSLCFAEDFSKALAFHGYHNITVLGYTGYVNSEDPFRESLSEVGQSDVFGSKIKHCRLEEGQVVYQDGVLVSKPKKTLVENYTYDKDEIKKDSSLRKYLEDRKKMSSIVKIDDIDLSMEGLQIQESETSSSNDEANSTSFEESIIQDVPATITYMYTASGKMDLKDEGQVEHSPSKAHNSQKLAVV